MRSSTLTEDRKHPNHWYNRASDLHASAGALWHAMDDGEGEIAAELGLPTGFSMYTACHPVYYMLCGLALEVIMKAVLVQRGVPEKKYETHEFSKLTALLGVSPTNEEQALLRFYEASLVWAGRYPTPKRATDAEILGFWALAIDVQNPTVEGVASGDWEHFTKLWHTYAAAFQHR